ncbi:hypothetical protein QYM36_003034, partial [Artemia franciscana]
MLVINSNDVKIYNLSHGKSLPEWLSDKKRRALMKKDLDVRRRIELIQDFDMPAVSDCIQMSPDGQYILVTGVYKPRVRCFEVKNLSMKFERCFDSEVTKFQIISDDYSKVVFLQCDRYVEFHAQFGRYYRLRIPKFGRDLKYHYPSCDLFVVGSGPDIYRINLEQGRFLAPFTTDASELNALDINPLHQLLVVGTKEGKVEAWDPRAKRRAGVLDCALGAVTTETRITSLPAVTSLKFKDSTVMGVGTSTGQILLYDIRSDKPFTVKDHQYGKEIKKLAFHPYQGHDLVASMDSRVLRYWDKDTGKPFCSIEAKADFNDFCLVPDTGMMFLANEDKKMLTYYIPSLGPAPSWCSFLDNLTEELEETNVTSVYDDYKFVTAKDLDELGLSHLIGSEMLRAYMHGYFMDLRLYKKAKSLVDPFSIEKFKKKKISEKIDEERANRVQVRKLPKINQELALKLINDEESIKVATQEGKKVKQNKVQAASILHDERFKLLFENPDFEVDKNADEYKLLNPVVSRLDKQREKKLRKELITEENEEEEEEGRSSNGEDSDFYDSSEDEKKMAKELSKTYKKVRRDKEQREYEARQAARNEPKFFEVKTDSQFGNAGLKTKSKRSTLEERLQIEEQESITRPRTGGVGSREMTFTLKQSEKFVKAREEAKKHFEERRQIRRSAKGMHTKKVKLR